MMLGQYGVDEHAEHRATEHANTIELIAIELMVVSILASTSSETCGYDRNPAGLAIP
jgi:hypothetical protein